MSAALVRKSLALVDSDAITDSGKRKRSKKNINSHIIPENQKLYQKVNRRGHSDKVNLLQRGRKLTVLELKKTYKTKQERQEENRKKLKKIHEICQINLSGDIIKKIINRATTGRPIATEQQPEEAEQSKTVFTEEDFKKFEEEYVDE